MSDVYQIKSLIEKGALARPDMQRPFEIRMSTAGFCQRQMELMALKGKPEVDADTAMRLLIGEPIHAFWREHLESVFPNDFYYAEDELKLSFEVDGETITVTGHPDGYIRSLNALVEVKSVSEHTFQKIQTEQLPLSSHYEQANIYAEVLDARRILFIYHNRNSGAFEIIEAPHVHQLAQTTVAKWAQVHRNVRAGIVSDRPYHDATVAPCSFCHYRDDCYKDFSGQVKGFERNATTHLEAVGLTGRYMHHREQRLFYEKLEKRVKDELARYMFKHKQQQLLVNIGEKPFADITLTVGKNNNPLINIKDRRHGEK